MIGFFFKLLGFAFPNNTDKKQVGPPQAEIPNRTFIGLNPTYKFYLTGEICFVYFDE